MADEKAIKNAQAVYAALCSALDEVEWKYDRNDDGLEVTCGAQGYDLPIPLRVSVDADKELICIYSVLPFKAPENKWREIAVAVSAANSAIVAGSFDFNCKNGMLLFRYNSVFTDSIIGKGLFKYIIMVTCATVDQYNDRFLEIVNKDMTFDEIVEFVERR